MGSVRSMSSFARRNSESSARLVRRSRRRLRGDRGAGRRLPAPRFPVIPEGHRKGTAEAAVDLPLLVDQLEYVDLEGRAVSALPRKRYPIVCWSE